MHIFIRFQKKSCFIQERLENRGLSVLIKLKNEIYNDSSKHDIIK